MLRVADGLFVTFVRHFCSTLYSQRVPWYLIGCSGTSSASECPGAFDGYIAPRLFQRLRWRRCLLSRYLDNRGTRIICTTLAQRKLLVTCPQNKCDRAHVVRDHS